MDGSTRRGMRLLLVAFLLMTSPVFVSGALAQESGVSERDTNADSVGESLTMPGSPDQQTAVPNRMIVKFEPSENAAERAGVRSEEGLDKTRTLALIQAEVVEVSGRSAAEAARDLENRAGVEYAVPDRIVYPAGYSDEPRFADLWGLNNIAQAVNGGPTGTADIDIDGLEASAVTQGDPNLVVAVIDEGVDFSHPDLRERAWVNTGEIPDNSIDDDGNGYTDDVNGFDFFNFDGSVYDEGEDRHGTHVAGTIAASVNSEGVVGVAPNVKIMSLKFLGPSGGYLSDAILALEYAKANGVKIANNSWTTEPGSPDPALKDAIEASGMLFVAAAGNQSLNNDADPNNAVYPSSFDNPNILSVAAATNQGELWTSSNYGATTVDIAAPGKDILSTVPGGGWDYMSGTSMAAPHVTGAAALIASVNPTVLADPVSLKQFILNGAKPLPASTGKTVTGGIVNAKPDTTAPTVTTVSPTDGAQQVVAYASVEAKFSEAMRSSTVNADTFTLVKQGTTTPVNAVVTYDAADKKAVLTPNAGLSPSSTYIVTLKGSDGGAKDLFGNPLAADKVWSFTTAPPDTTSPNTTITSGPDGYTPSSSVSFAFSSSEPRSTFLCRIDWEQVPPSSSTPPSLQPCDTPKQYAALGEGLHMFEVKAVDFAGNTDATAASRSFFVDTVDPTVSAPSNNFVVPSTLGVVTANYTVPVRISWSGADQGGNSGSGTNRYELQRSVNSGPWSGDLLQQQPVPPAAGGPETSVTFSHTLGSTYKYRVRAQDVAGNYSNWVEGTSSVNRAYDEVSSPVTYPIGSWVSQSLSGAYNGNVKYETDMGARSRLSFTGREAAWVTAKGPNRGKAEVWVDGVQVTTIDLYASTVQPRTIVFRRAWATSGSHAVVVVLTGTKNSSSTNTRVDVDAFVVEN